MRSASLAGGLVVTWAIATFGALVVAVVVAWPLALFRGGDVLGSRSIGFVLGFVGFGIWAIRTSITLVRDHRSDADAFRARWPDSPRGVELRSSGVLDRRGQPGPAALRAGDHDVDLRGGERAETGIVLEQAARVHVAIEGPSDAIARVLDVELEEHGRVATSGASTATFRLEAGTYRLMVERTDSSERGRERVQSWWIGTAP